MWEKGPRLYAVSHKLGNPMFNFDLTNDGTNPVLGATDRSTIIGSAIPSGVIITILGSNAVGFVGVGGGVHKPTLPSTKIFYPRYWKTVF